MLTGVSLEDRIEVPSQRQFTDAGQMIVPCAFARTGGQQYTAGQLGLRDMADDEVVTVFRDEADVFDEASLATFRSVPVTIGHPKIDGKPVLVDSENAKELQVGVLEGMPVRDEDTLTGTLVIARQDAIDLIDEGTKELSAGYTCDIEMVDAVNGEMQLFQRNIRANHIAIVAKGRAGSSCAIADEDDTQPEATDVTEEVAKEEAVEVEVAEVAEVEAVEEESAEEVVADEAVEVKVEVADEEVVAEIKLEDELEAVKVASAKLTDELEAAQKEVSQLRDELDKAVEERCHVVMVAKDLTDLDDFSGKSVAEIKRMVVADQMPSLSLDGKSEAYICARFDIFTEDADLQETPMGRLLRDNADAVRVEAKPSSVVADARQRAIERQSKR